MIGSIWQDVKQEFNYGNMISRLVIINAACFVLINLVQIILFAANGGQRSPVFETIVEFLSLNADPWLILTRPWTIVSHMFLHLDFFHILANMLFLYWFGRIVGDFIGNHRVLPLYLMGGLFGAIVYFTLANLLQHGGNYALGASAAVMALVTAAGAMAPDYIMRLLFIGDVKLKYIVAVLIFLDLISIANSVNTGGHFAHLGGALFGWLYIGQLQRGHDWAKPLSTLFSRLSAWWDEQVHGYEKPRPRPKVAYRSPKVARSGSGAAASPSGPRPGPTGPDEKSHQERLDEILDKIKLSGYDSLTAEEKEFLFNASKN